MLDLSAGLLLFTCFFTVTDESAWCDRRLARADDCQAPNTGGVIASPSLASITAAFCCIYLSSHPSTYQPSVYIHHGYRRSHHIQGRPVRRKCMLILLKHVSSFTTNAHRRAKRSSLMPLPATSTSTKKMVLLFATHIIDSH